MNIVTPKPNLAYPDHDLHESLERVLREILSDTNGNDRWGKTKVTNHAHEPRPANAPRKSDLHPSNNRPAAMVARRSTGSGAP